jgi:ATP-dependent DNA helicase RecQ
MQQYQDPKSVLNEFFGFDGFKGNQEEIVTSVLKGEDCFVIMPTGAGKSLCYQLPAIMMEGTALVISPLIALMKNQVDQIRGFASTNSLAHFMNSSLTKTELTTVKEDILSGETKILYIAPETLKKEETIEFFKQITISFVAVDEAHCISEWGHDFRPEYRRIKEMVKGIDDVPMMALTATATPKVQNDIRKNLGMIDAVLYKSSFNRSNLYYEVQPKGNKEQVAKRIISYIRNNMGKSGIIYCLSRKKVEDIAELLKVNGIKALPYHAGMDAKTRASHQDKFLMEDVDVIVATIAFGMGIDKPDVRFVMHYDVPKSLEGHYQETGRSGRDGLQGDCILFYNPYDIEKLEKFMKDKSVAEREIGTQLISEMSAFAESSQCRRKFILNYFGEEFDEDNCDGMCDNCRHPKEKSEVSMELKLGMETLISLKGEFALSHITNFMVGKKSDSIKDYSHDESPSFGVGKEKDKVFWKSIFRLGLLHGYIFKNIEKYGLLSVTDKGKDYLKSPIPHMMAVDVEFEKVSEEDYESVKVESIADEELLLHLKDIRKKVAIKLELPPYVIFQEPSLEDMATKYPVTIDELANINGVGKNKAAKFGKEFVAFISKFVEENDIQREQDIVVKSVADKSGKKIAIIVNIDKKVPLEDIAKGQGMSYEELLDELELIVGSGTKLDLTHSIDEMVDQDYQDEIYDYFKETEEDDIDAAVEEFEGEFAVEELQLMRLQFLSDNAN